MKKNSRNGFLFGFIFIFLFIMWTLSVRSFDLQAIGPNGSYVGFGRLNLWAKELLGVHFFLYYLTDWLSVLPLMAALGFGILGLAQWIKRRSFFKVDFNLIILGAFYLLVIGAFALFEILSINFRPVLIDGVLEASYPSSTTLLITFTIPTAIIQLREYISNRTLYRIAYSILSVFGVFMVVCRLISGVHWLSDIVGGLFLGAGLVSLYYGTIKIKQKKNLN